MRVCVVFVPFVAKKAKPLSGAAAMRGEFNFLTFLNSWWFVCLFVWFACLQCVVERLGTWVRVVDEDENR